MKIAYINSIYPFGSTGGIVRGLADFCANDEVKVFYGRGEEGEGKILSSFSLLLGGAFTRLFGREGLRRKRATKKLVKKLEEFNPDVIHIHNLHGYYINYEIFFSYLKRANKKVVWTLHDEWAFTGHCSYFDGELCKEYSKNCKGCKNKRAYPKSYFDNCEKNYLRKKKAFLGVKDLTIVTPSVWLKGEVEKSFLSCYKTEVIPNGVDISVFKKRDSNFREKYGLENKKIILGVAYVWTERKGLHIFNELACDLPENYAIVLVGKAEKLNERIIRIPKTENKEELAEIYSACDIFVNPTLFENYPTVNVEALSCLMPVITFSSGGSGEVITPFNGKVVARDNYEKLKQAVLESDFSDKAAMEKERENYNEKHAYSKYYELYLGRK